MNSSLTTLDRSKYEMAKRRIGIALATIEDGQFDLLTPENVVSLLNAALLDLEEARIEQSVNHQVSSGIDWNEHASLSE